MLCIVPPVIQKKQKEFYELIDANPDYIGLPDVARFLGVNAEGLRCAIDQGRVSFGFSWKKNARANKGYKIPTIVFYNWVRQSSAEPFIEEYLK